ncbi:MAG TPA: class I SAM-dependent methyltransferase [Dehalococcoidales bacterium]|nr:class I SAM-dependent methyltransferase [Dehalococcoidales bacterium]
MKQVNKEKEIKEYWEKSTPISFVEEKWSYEQKRKFRYDLQDYEHDSFRFEDWAGKQVIEIGCGSGIDAMEFARNGAIVTATDITDNAVNLTKGLSQETGIPLNVVQTPPVKLPFPDKSFDCAYSFGVLHHIPDPAPKIDEIHRVLRDDGTLLAMLYNKNSLLYAYSIVYRHGVIEKLLTEKGFSEADLVSRYSERFEGCPYTKAYTKEEAQTFFSRWFRNVEVTVRYNVIDTEKQRKVKLGLDDTWELGWHLLIRATGKK